MARCITFAAATASEAASGGKMLNTESPLNLMTVPPFSSMNVPLYEHLGYRLVGHARLSPTMGTWGFFRPD